ncbi:hypothetical protein AT864_02822 [Anoxybacillus sp. P3H1B]|uniref:FUSC family protein n=1 Tax=Anoxybacillus sp. P3H1B TaxID=1769293 RepID=UPI000796DF85|nr:FUSC family protein [Anoxybacillus sp. P3H1B]KXG08914.1 hypothetical protein AT864_02822 [Anoxybacillus sp. P3H1B]
MKNNKSRQQRDLIKGIMLIVKIALAAGVSWEVAKLLGSKHPYLAPLTVILSMQETVWHSAAYAFYRMIGTVFGVAVTVFIVSRLEVSGWTIGCLLLGGMLLPVILRVHKTIIHQVALTILLVFVFAHQTASYASDRVRDTIVGAFTAIFIHMLLFPPSYMKEAGQTLNQFGFHLIQLFKRSADWVHGHCDPLEGQALKKDVADLLQELHQVQKDLQKAEKSLKLNIFSKNKQQSLKQYKHILSLLTTGYLYISNILPPFHDWTKMGTMSADEREQWTMQLKMLGEYMGNQLHQAMEKQNHSGASGRMPDLLDLSALSLQISVPSELKWYRYPLSLYQQTAQFIQELKMTRQ